MTAIFVVSCILAIAGVGLAVAIVIVVNNFPIAEPRALLPVLYIAAGVAFVGVLGAAISAAEIWG